MKRLLIIPVFVLLQSCASSPSVDSPFYEVSKQESFDNISKEPEKILEKGSNVAISVCHVAETIVIPSAVRLYINDLEKDKISGDSSAKINALVGDRFKLAQKKNGMIGVWEERILYQSIIQNNLYLLYSVKRNNAQTAGFIFGGIIGGALVDNSQDAVSENWNVKRVSSEEYNAICEHDFS